MSAARGSFKPVAALRTALDRASIYLPVLLMGLLALGSYWLVRSTPPPAVAEPERPVRHEPDYFMRDFAVRNFDKDGKLTSEIFGTEGRHYPDTDTLEIDKPRIRSFSKDGKLTVATANTALSNGDGSEVQLFGNAIVTREATTDARGQPVPQMQFRSEFLHAFTETERVKSHKPVVLTRGQDQFTGDGMDYDNYDQVANLRGRVRGIMVPTPRAAPAAAPAPVRKR
ncbi:LPS export ABC transporter periplasmic protein LptC [Xylophilus sp. Leaf220]|uniref:LPS export ABC transporter periplasmic protein LptC n=1 Tax=Xylophilus sp. Leaf220 TaxID=1735686 RepID=UPI000AE0ACC8|nr:LPS export ABC transporter periplasmic protein LptC [Xylophilus sp. Leaf220]